MKAQSDSTGRNLLWPVLVVAFIVFSLLVLAALLDIRLAYVVPLIVVTILLGGAIVLWRWATARADGSEWWQDNDASGWRGY